MTYLSLLYVLYVFVYRSDLYNKGFQVYFIIHITYDTHNRAIFKTTKKCKSMICTFKMICVIIHLCD